MSGSAGSMMSIAKGLSAMIEAITTTNSGKPIGWWLEETQLGEAVELETVKSMRPVVKRRI
jgi:hypothetical protein